MSQLPRHRQEKRRCRRLGPGIDSGDPAHSVSRYRGGFPLASDAPLLRLRPWNASSGPS
jgi:hypothetical protein